MITIEGTIEKVPDGYCLIVHSDFLQGHSLSAKIHEYGFFSYASNEALHLSDREEAVIEGLFENLQHEINSATDAHTQEVVLSHIELLLSYCNRFYNRQFITRKNANNSLVAQKLNVSTSYLGDMLRYHTGMNTQQHIHNKVIERAKVLLTTTNQSVAEIAYQIGFEHPQSFNKLFKSKTNQSPLEYRQSFN